MTKKTIYTEAAAAAMVLLVLAGLPLLLWYWQAVAVPGRYPPGTKIIGLTAIADGGIWTRDRVAGYNYWWKAPARANGISLRPGDHVVLLLHSADVQHSFVMRDLNIGPVPVAAGHTAEVEFKADRPGLLNFICMQVCGRDHNHMSGYFDVAEASGPHGAGASAPPKMEH